MITKDRNICIIWNETVEAHPDKSTEWQLQMTCELYNVTYRDEIQPHEVLDALEARENER